MGIRFENEVKRTMDLEGGKKKAKRKTGKKMGGQHQEGHGSTRNKRSG
eukprot:gene7881-13763_t